MCSKTLPLLRKTSYDFTSLAPYVSETIVIAAAVDVASFYRMTLWVRAHNLQMSAGQLVHFEVDPVPVNDFETGSLVY